MRVSPDFVPELGRPEAVSIALDEAAGLRDRLRQASEELAAAEAEYERQKQADVANAAERARKGAALGNVPQTVEKARHQVELAKRTAAAIGLASQAAQDDLASTIIDHRDEWTAMLDAEAARACEEGHAALEALRAVCVRVADAQAAREWVSGENLDRRPVGVVTALVAASSRRVTANSAPLSFDAIIGYAAELIDPPAIAVNT